MGFAWFGLGFLALWLGILPWAGLSQSASKKPRPSTAPAEKREPNDERLMQALQQVRTLSDRVIAFRSLADRTRGLIALADILWKLDNDYARGLLTKACESLSASAATRSGPSAELKEITGLRQEALGRIAKLDSELAWRLAETWLDGDRAKDLDPAARSMTYLQTALSVVESKPDEAVKFAGQSIKAGISQTTISFLDKIRQTDERAARRFFISLLAAVGSLETFNGNDLLLLGCYVFSQPSSDDRAQVSAVNGITWALVGELTVVNIAGREPALPLDQVQAYLKMASSTLRRPGRTGKDRVFNYFAAYQLLPYLRQYLPSEAPEVEMAMLALKADVPPQWTQPGSNSNLTLTRAAEPEKAFAQIENEIIADKRDVLAVTLTQAACSRSDFGQAEKLVLYISDLGVRAKVRTLVAFCRALKQVEQGEIAAARQAATNIGAGVEPAVLWLAIGRRSLESGDKNSALEALLAALQVARNLDRGERAATLIAVAGQYARLHPTTGLQVFEEAVHALNSFEAHAYRPYRWVQQVRIAGRVVEFSLGINVSERGIAPTIDRIASTDPDGATSAVLKLTNERLLGEALVALSGALLKSRKPRQGF